MTHFILDTNVLLADPEVVTKWHSCYKFVIARIIYGELDAVSVKKGGTVGRLWQHLEAAASKKFIATYEGEIPVPDNVFKFDFDLQLSFVDLQLYELARTFRQDGKDVIVVTNDRALRVFCEKLDIRTYNLYQLYNFMLPLATVSVDDLAENQDIESFGRRKSIVGTGVGMAFSALVCGGFFLYRTVFENLGAWVVLLLLPLGYAFFWWRFHFKTPYGAFAIGFGFLILLRIFFKDDFYAAQITGFEIAQLLVALYCIASGFSNINDGMKGKTFGEKWKRIIYWPLGR